jgi:hypothetical protein
MNKKNIIFVVFMITVLLLLLTISGKKFPPIPDDPDHLSVITIEACQECHNPDGKNPLMDSHPPKFECFKCHKPK